MTKVAIIIGHTDTHKGASMRAPFDFIQEYEYNTILAGMIKARFKSIKIKCEIFTRDLIGLARTYQNVEKSGADISIELHFNAATSRRANGCEILCGPQEGCERLADAILSWLRSDIPDLKYRGIKKIGNGDRGWFNLSRLRTPQIIYEPFFGSNEADCLIALQQMPDIAQAIVDGCMTYFVPRAINESRH